MVARAIPTCVGTTRWTPWPPGRSSGHPHVRGDYMRIPDTAHFRVGPSPRAWGLRALALWTRYFWRAIPTCVGTTLRRMAEAHFGTGHPHVRGDYMMTTPSSAANRGPSPRAWGLLALSRAGTAAMRAIPTCVGTTDGERNPPWNASGHPHVRGDYGRPPGVAGAAGGPSPRAWGLRYPLPGQPGYIRAIPTCVGTTRGLTG